MAREQFQTLTEPMYYILLALLEECCGVDIMDKVQELSHGRVRVGPGTLYAMLSKFEENSVIRMTGHQQVCCTGFLLPGTPAVLLFNCSFSPGSWAAWPHR